MPLHGYNSTRPEASEDQEAKVDLNALATEIAEKAKGRIYSEGGLITEPTSGSLDSLLDAVLKRASTLLEYGSRTEFSEKLPKRPLTEGFIEGVKAIAEEQESCLKVEHQQNSSVVLSRQGGEPRRTISAR